ncbi:hypothetical protein ACPPVO_57655 [Dactylosporangium sp. McL0621]
MPPSVEYALTPKGAALMSALAPLTDFAVRQWCPPEVAG